MYIVAYYRLRVNSFFGKQGEFLRAGSEDFGADAVMTVLRHMQTAEYKKPYLTSRQCDM